tara:strand:- start:819 stop:1715 length:897 start_codon:yes stop_codon:yes gene_type:complete
MSDELNQGLRGLLNPGYITKEEIEKAERDKFYKENIEGKAPPGAQVKGPPEDPVMNSLVTSPEPLLKFSPTKESPIIKKHNAVMKHYTRPKAKPMNVVSYVNKMNKLYNNADTTTLDEPGATPEQMRGLEKRLENSRAFGYDPNRDPKTRAKAFERMAQDEADSLNFIKRTNWERENGGRGPKPKYVSKDDVMNVYLKPGTPLPPKRLHKELEMRKLVLSEDPVKSAKTTNQLKALNKFGSNKIVEDDHPYLKHKEDQINNIIKKGKSLTLPLLDPSLKKEKKAEREEKWKYQGRNYD